MIKQKLIGAAFVAAGIISALPTKDITAAIFFVPLGIYILFNHKGVCDVGEEGGDNVNT